MNLYLTFVVILVTVGVAFWLGWIFNRGAAELDRLRLLDQLDQATANAERPRHYPPHDPKRCLRCRYWDRMDAGHFGQAGRLARLEDGTNHVLADMGFADAQDASYQAAPPAPVPWDLASAAYVLGQQRAAQDEVSREVEAIFTEVEHNPERWQT